LIFTQLVDDDLGCASYLVGDAGEAVVVDPAFAIEQYLEHAKRERVRIVRVLETHTHADHLSGHGRFALEHELPVSIHPLARPEYPFEPLADDQILRVGGVEIRVVHTPGHRPEHCAFVVDDALVLTGDSLFVGDAARPDLAIEAREGAADLHRSLRHLAELPDATVVYPGHVSGSLCGSNMSDEHSSSIGRERQTNHALRTKLADFVEESASLTTPKPPTTERLVALNRGPWVGARPALAELESVDGAIVVDTRPVDVFAAGHLPGAISVALDGGSFATRAAFVLETAEPVVLHAGSRAEADEASRLLTAVGLFEQVGFFAGNGSEQLQTVSVPELRRLRDRSDVQMLDVREPNEVERHPLPGAITVPYRSLRVAPPGDLDVQRPVYTICASGARATLAASLLVRQGFDARPVVGGGVEDL
jgi:glyoxylase-like metal-dependent hydrolase (beta-lactamase superfamily II)/rhodanese-related sulfurtransferase